jgi:hypothetical protein
VSASEIERDLKQLEVDLKQLESEYNMYFAGRVPRPPLEMRSRVEALVKRCDRRHIPNYADRFRFSTLQSRFITFAELWDRGLRAREEGRPGPFPDRGSDEPQGPPPATRIVTVVTFDDVSREEDKLRDLYQRLEEARRETGQDSVPFGKFATIVGDEVRRLRREGSLEVAVRVKVENGRVSVTARGLKGVKEDLAEE